MKAVILICWFFAFPCFVINGAKVPKMYPKEVKRLDILAKSKTKINEALMLKENGLLGEGRFGIVYEGVLLANDPQLANDRSVAIKFVPNEYSEYCEREFEMFSYLNAYRNEHALKFGIPIVYYYDRWKSYTLIALTKFDADLRDIANQNDKFRPLDVLILFRDFVFQSKYIHRYGVRHDDIKPHNIMVRGHRSFLIDFNLSSQIMEDNGGASKDYACKRFASGATRRPIDDWESFLYTMSAVLRTKWFGPNLDNKSRMNNLCIENQRLNKVIKAFANEVFTDDDSKEFPNYDTLEKLIGGEIEKMSSNPEPKFSWLKAEAEVCPARHIRNIPEPKSIDFTRFDYPHVLRLPRLKQ